MRTELGEGVGDSASDAAAGAGDDGEFAGELGHGVMVAVKASTAELRSVPESLSEVTVCSFALCRLLDSPFNIFSESHSAA